jgi:hypothetical protein
VPTLFYQSQTLAIDKRIKTCKMRCLRKIVNKFRRDRVRNINNREIIEKNYAWNI